MKKEFWKKIPKYEYEVSTLGRIVRLHKFHKRFRKIILDRRGYPFIMLYKNGIGKNFRVHRLVAEAFIPNSIKLLEINHKDGNKENNNVLNLEWCTEKYNTQHAFKTGIAKFKLNFKQAIFIRKNKGIISASSLAEKFSISKPTIYAIWSNKVWK